MNKLVRLLNKKERGFTLIELIVVIGILAILAILAFPAIAGYFKSAKAQTNISNAKVIYNAVNAYLASNPTAENVPTKDQLIADEYFKTIPLTAGEAEYTIDGTVDEPNVHWVSETGLVNEDPAGEATSGTFYFPAGSEPATPAT
jgi:type IV pilus assembly protein PilA